MQPIANPKEARLSPSHHFGATSNTFSPMSEAAAADAAPSPALLLWIIRHGPAHLLDIVNRFIRQLHQTLLPQLWKHLRQLPAVSLAPVWLAAKHSLVSLIHAWVSEICHKIAAAWLQLYSRLKHYLEQSHSRQEPPCQADTKAEPVTQQQGTESWQDRVKASGAPRLSSQSVEPTFTTASASSGAVQQLPEEAAGSLETGDIAEASSELDATQEPTMVVDDDIKAYLSPRQDAISGPHSPNPRDAISGSLSSLSKDAAGMTTSPHPQVAASKPHSPMPMSAVLSRPNLLLKDAVLGSLSPLPMGDEKQKAGMEQRVATPPRRERLQGNWSTGAAWLQSQATSAAALSASHDVQLTSAAAASACIASTPLPVCLGKHRRHASTSPFTLPDQEAFSTSPLPKDIPRTAPGPAPAHDMSASPLRSKADQQSAASMAASTSANDTPATSAHLTGQQSLQKATIALKGLQRKYGQAGSTPHGNSSSDFLRISQQASSALGSAADTEAALEVAAAPSASRSSFEFRPVVGLRGATRMSEGVYPSSLLEEGHPSRVSEGATRVSERAHPSREPEEAHSSRVSDKAHPSSSADESPLAGAGSSTSPACHLREEGDTAQTSQSCIVAQEQPRDRPVKQKKCRALQISKESVQEVDVHSLQSPGLVLLHHHALAPDELARLNDSYALALQNRSVTLKSWSPQPSEPQAARHSRGCPALPEADPKPVPAGQVLEGQSPDGQLFGTQSRGQFPEGKVLEGQGRGQFPEGQVLEGQGRGLFLGPPAQRWASDSALKESMNRLPTVPEGEEDGVDEPDSAPHLLPCASGSGSPTDAPGKETLQLPAGRSSCTAHSSMSGKTKRRVSFAVSRVQHYPADQENVPV